MRTFPLTNDAGELRAFEVPVPLRGRRWICGRIAKIPGVKLLRAPKALSWLREEVFCEFQYEGVLFQVWEPYGDNSRYWIGPSENRACAATMNLMEAFR